MGKESKKAADPDGLSKEERAELDFIQFKVLFSEPSTGRHPWWIESRFLPRREEVNVVVSYMISASIPRSPVEHAMPLA